MVNFLIFLAYIAMVLGPVILAGIQYSGSREDDL
jgi:hypothetical protein